MLEAVLAAVRSEGLPPFTTLGEVVSCHHNYIRREHHFGDAVMAAQSDLVEIVATLKQVLCVKG